MDETPLFMSNPGLCLSRMSSLHSCCFSMVLMTKKATTKGKVGCVQDLAERHGGGRGARQSCRPDQSAFVYRHGRALDDGATAVSGQCHRECDGLGAAVPWGAPALVRLVNALHHLGWTTVPWMQPTETR